MKTSYKIYIILIMLLSILAAVSVFIPQGELFPTQELPASKPVLAIVNFFIMVFIYGGLGWLGVTLSEKIGFAHIWDESISIQNRFIQPFTIGVGLGISFILMDLIFSKYHSLGALPHPPFPLSLVASMTAAIGEEIITRLFFISFWVWLISDLLLKKRKQNMVFWIVSIFSAILFTIMHIPSIFVVYGLQSINEIPPILLMELFLMNGSLALLAAYHFREYGFLAAVGIHFWADVVWHVIFGLIS
jgi:hypothetical protein